MCEKGMMNKGGRRVSVEKAARWRNRWGKGGRE